MLDFPRGPVVKILSFHCRGHRLIPGQETKIPQVVGREPKKKKRKKKRFSLLIRL